MLVNHMAEGLSLESFSAIVGVHRQSLYDWCEAHPEFSYAKKVGIDASMLFWEKVNRGQAIGDIKGSPANTIFTMKCRFGWKEADTQQQDITVKLAYNLDDSDT